MEETILEAAVDSVHATYRTEVARLKMQLVVYRQALEDHGIEPPDMEGADLLQMVRDANAVISTASEFVHHLGSSKELLHG